MVVNMAKKKHVFNLLVIILQLEVQVRSQFAQQQQQRSEEITFGAQEMFSSSTQNLMDEMFQRGEEVVRGVGGAIGGEKTSPELVGNLIFQPSLLDFLERSIGDPHNQVVILINKHKSRSVVLGSISGSTPDVYSSYFKDMVIPPEGNTTFNVVFLPRQLGVTTGSIEIHTSFGLLKYEVKGKGIECPYRLRPLVGLKAPLNATITPEITLYNPHDSPLQIMEIYSSGGNFQLELPSGAQEGPQALWEIPPHSTRSVIRVRFHGKSAGNYTAYVRIKISGGTQEPTLIDKMLVVPIEIEVFKETGIYSKVPLLDLGIVGSSENITKISLNLTNSGERELLLRTWGAMFNDMQLVHSSKLYTSFDHSQYTLHFEIDQAKINAENRFVNGEIFVGYHFKDEEDVHIYKIPFCAQFIKGRLKYNPDVLKFLASTEEMEQNAQLQVLRPLVIRNKFSVPLSISNITVPENCSKNFRIEGFRSKVIQPYQEETLLRISRILTSNLNRSIATYIRLMTNITDYDLPVYGYTGKLKRILPFSTTTFRPPTDYEKLDLDERELNFGILPISTIGETLIAFFNTNPVEIPIRHWKGAITSESAGASTITVILRGCGPHTGENLIFCHTIQPKHWIVFQISVQSSTTDSYQGTFSITTDYEEIVTPISFTTAVGKLELNRELLHFDNCFPGKLCSLNLTAHSTFVSKIHVEGVKTDVNGIEFESRHQVIHPNTQTSIGRLVFDPKVICKVNCYSSFDLLSKPFGVKWMATLDNHEEYRKLDSEKLLQQLRLHTEMRKSWKSIRFQLITDPIRKFEFNASVDLVWPKLLTENIFFPTLQVEQEAVKLITISNPSDQILFVHLVLHDADTHGRDISALPSEILSTCDNCTLSYENVFSFFLFDLDDIYVNYVKPNSFLKIAVKFVTKVPGTYSTIFYMRNNLTLIDAVWVQAKAVVPQFKFGNRKPGSTTPLQFEITDKHLKMCSKYQEPGIDENNISIQTKRSFTARNYGEVPILISGIRVEDILCEGYGFKVLDCSPFELQPNASKKIEIAFSPDFTLARVTRTLNFDTNINFAVNFTLLGTVPAHGLESCSLSLKRPWFESILRVVMIFVLSLAFMGTLVAAFLDANKVFKDHILNLSRDRGPIQPPLDLRQIALQSPVPTDETLEKASSVGNNCAKGSQNSAKKKTPAKQTNPRAHNGSVNGFNKTWNEFTSKFGRNFTSKPVEVISNKPSPESEKRSQKNRRSITPPKEETTSNTSVSNNISSSTSAKEQSKPSIEEDSSSTTTECSDTSSTLSSTSAASSTQSIPVASYKASSVVHENVQPAVEMKAAIKAPATNQPLHHASSRTPTSDLKHESNSAINSSGISPTLSINNGYHQQAQSKATQHSHHQQHVHQHQPAIKTNVKKTKSLPVGYELGLPLSLGTSIVNVTNYQPHHHKHSTSFGTATSPSAYSSSSKDSSNSSTSGGMRNSGKNHDKGSGKNTSRNADKSREHSGKENGTIHGDNNSKDSTQIKKFGKTPGRERKSNNQNKKGSNSKTLHKAQALHFSSPPSGKSGNSNSNGNRMFLPSTIPAPPNVWNENRARFSDVVAQATLDKTSPGISSKISAFDINSGLEGMVNFTAGSSTATMPGSIVKSDASKVAANLFGKTKDDSYVGCEKDTSSHSADLGPIGASKKSPQPISKCWEPFGNVTDRSFQDMSNSDSFFSRTFGDFGDLRNNANNNANTNGRSLEDFLAQSTYANMNSAPMNPTRARDSTSDSSQMSMEPREWDAATLCHMIKTNEELNASSMLDWSAFWPPVMNNEMRQSVMHSRLTSNWLNPGVSRPPNMPLRAPPGFSPVKPASAPLLTQQQAQVHMANVQHQQQLSAQSSSLQSQQDLTGVAASSSSVPTYDPFRLSSIWAPANPSNDTWNEK